MDRLDLQAKLEAILGSRNVYYQPPSGVILNYPCIVYTPEQPTIRKANNRNYYWVNRYEVKVITNDIETSIPRVLTEEFPTSSAPRYYQTDNLHHFSLTLEC